MLTVVEVNNVPVKGAKVDGHWEGAMTIGAVSGITDANGQISFGSKPMKNPPDDATFTFVIDNVTKKGEWNYMPTANGDFNNDGVSGDISNSISLF